MTRVAVRAVFFSAAILGLAACEEGLNLGQGGNSGADSAAPAVNLEGGTATRDVERPDIFETTEEALWDGRPSLGGIWVAHPDVTTPERAIVTNNSTNQRIAAALFRRERDNPGPRIQLSSDAAAALNILAGAPTEVTIVAVRPEEIEVEEPDPVISDEVVGDEAETIEGQAAEDGDDVAAAAAATEAATAERTRRPNFLERLFGRRSPAPAAAAATAAATVDGAETAASAATPDVETQTLDPVATGAAAAIARAEATDKPEPRPTREAAPSGLRNPFIQVGQFSEEANAFSARDNLRTAGIVPTVLEGTNDNGPFWRVIVGPVTSANEQAWLLGEVRNLGFKDAFLTSR